MISIEKNLDQVKLEIHVVGTGKYILCAPKEIACNDNLLERFSKKDIRTITYYACSNLNKPTHKIIGMTFCENIKKLIFRLKNHDVNNFLEKASHEMSADRLILSGLSPEDAHRIGYAYGRESVLSENEEKQKMLSKN